MKTFKYLGVSLLASLGGFAICIIISIQLLLVIYGPQDGGFGMLGIYYFGFLWSSLIGLFAGIITFVYQIEKYKKETSNKANKEFLSIDIPETKTESLSSDKSSIWLVIGFFALLAVMAIIFLLTKK